MPCLKLPMLLPRWNHHDADSVSEYSPLLQHQPRSQPQPQPQAQKQETQTLKSKYGTCTSILHYGTHSSVRLYSNTNNNTNPKNKDKQTLHVIKTLRPSSSSNTITSTQQTLKNTLECLLSSTLSHPHLLRTIDILPNSQLETCLVSEYCPLGDLGAYISSIPSSSSPSRGGKERRGRNQGLEIQEANIIFAQLLSAIAYLHSMGVAHGGGGICIKLTDLGHATVLDNHPVSPPSPGTYTSWMEKWAERDVYSLCLGVSVGVEGLERLSSASTSSPSSLSSSGPSSSLHIIPKRGKMGPYASPETIPCPTTNTQYPYYKGGYDPRASDVWAAGIIYLIMRMGRILWTCADEEDTRYEEYLIGRRRCEGFQGVEGLGSMQCRNVIYAMLDPDPRRRIRASEVVRSEWLFGYYS
ncbi:kinase-like protein [Aspergillus ibericus CBS 121593]|uniref:non-specific serine/threonine protein kinase n=1 Tax=Aspergillus ibericus CBS 121593 TaxID=1448316 RepID=A0A395GVR9_9EURO|nr:kinase-like protein [Aspergillus ibericus CBS 121593]RAK99670.1 kinase-like protein [Aspergillus ibericus CBS 121593]